MTKKNVTHIRATIGVTTPERTEYKPYKTELTFEGKVQVEVPVPTSEIVEVKGGVTVLTLEGWKCFLKEYTNAIEKLHREYQKSFI